MTIVVGFLVVCFVDMYKRESEVISRAVSGCKGTGVQKLCHYQLGDQKPLRSTPQGASGPSPNPLDIGPLQWHGMRSHEHQRRGDDGDVN